MVITATLLWPNPFSHMAVKAYSPANVSRYWQRYCNYVNASGLRSKHIARPPLHLTDLEILSGWLPQPGPQRLRLLQALGLPAPTRGPNDLYAGPTECIPNQRYVTGPNIKSTAIDTDGSKYKTEFPEEISQHTRKLCLAPNRQYNFSTHTGNSSGPHLVGPTLILKVH